MATRVLKRAQAKASMSALTKRRLAVVRGSQALDPGKGYSHYCDVTQGESSNGYVILTYRIEDGKPRDNYAVCTNFVSDKAIRDGVYFDECISDQISSAIEEDGDASVDLDDDDDDEDEEDEG